MTSPYDPQLLTLEQSIRTFASEVRQQIDAVANSAIAVADFDVPYFAGAIVDGREMWGVLLDFGPLPNATTKTMLIPQVVINEWGPMSERWIDTGNSLVYDPVSLVTRPIPYTSSIDSSGNKYSRSDQIAIFMVDNELRVITETDRTHENARIVLKYLKVPPP